ncbi:MULTISPECIES: DDE-type integrase/transposase/recombinase [Streptacidiphilus]|uniref:DDE-type integrase/transposase/recombinase n=1 Tax=Streptacidiphilus cavernicola TaxID=3342716 RepID=A0ABV6UF31_9ACTN|nr:DDE-type integrase/transposase/recombinase [Streptacidiphilus jeojiense]
MSGQAAGFLELVVGENLILDDEEWQVDLVEPQFGRVLLASRTGTRQTVSFRMLAHHPRCRRSTVSTASGQHLQPKTESDLSVHQRKLLRIRRGHLLEVETGYRDGDPFHPGLGEPRPQYDPDCTTVTQRRRAKVAELQALDPEHAKVLGLSHVSYRTLTRWESKRRVDVTMGCADDRWTPASRGHPSITEAVRKAILAVRQETLHRSKINMRARVGLIHQYVLETFGEEALKEIPSYGTLRVVWQEWFGTGRARQRYARSALLETTGEHVILERPGQVVALDTTVLPVMLREAVFDDPVTVHLTLAMDVYTHSLVGFRLTLVSDTSTDVAMLLRDLTMPLPMRASWGEDMEWPYPGVPAALVAEFAGHSVAALPFFSPETVTTDHGSVYRSHHLVQVQNVLGVRVLPARVLRPTDKQAVERAFGAVRSMLFEYLPGYTGVDASDRGADVEGDAVLTVEQMEQLLATWIVKVWQRRRLGEHAPCWDPVGDHSPNTLFAASMAQGGWALEIPSPSLYYQLLPRHQVLIQGKRGVKIRGLWYDGRALDAYRAEEGSGRGGRHKDRWTVHRDPRDARLAFFQDPRTHEWHELRWTGLPPEDEIPAFTDARVRELLTAAKQAGLKPRSDSELLPLLLELLAAYAKAEQWPGQLTKAQRSERAREAAQVKAAAADRPAAGTVGAAVGSRPARPVLVDEAVDAERRTRREATVLQPPNAPSRLGDGSRRRAHALLAVDDIVAADADSAGDNEADGEDRQ